MRTYDVDDKTELQRAIRATRDAAGNVTVDIDPEKLVALLVARAEANGGVSPPFSTVLP